MTPLPSTSYIRNAHCSFSSGVPAEVTSIANRNSCCKSGYHRLIKWSSRPNYLINATDKRKHHTTGSEHISRSTGSNGRLAGRMVITETNHELIIDIEATKQAASMARWLTRSWPGQNAQENWSRAILHLLTCWFSWQRYIQRPESNAHACEALIKFL